MSIVFVGSQQIGFDCLKKILQMKIMVSAVFTFKPDTHEIWINSVDSLAKKYDIPLYTDKLTVEFIDSLKPDLILVVGYRKLFPNQILQIPKYGVFGLHASLLPHLRGFAPLNWAILNNDSYSGVTLFKMDKGTDTGNIVDQESVCIKSLYISELRKIIAQLSVKLVEKNIPLILSGKNYFKKQPLEGTYGSYRVPGDGLINWNDKSIDIFNLIRSGESGYNAFTFLDGKKLYVKKAILQSHSSRYFGDAGQICRFLEDGSVLIKTGDGVINITRVCFEGENEVNSGVILKSIKIRLNIHARPQREVNTFAL